MQSRQMLSGSAPRMWLLVMIIMASDITSPRLQAKRLGLADTQCGGCRQVSSRASWPTGL